MSSGIVRSFGEIVDHILRGAGATGNTGTFRDSVRASVCDEYESLVAVVDPPELRESFALSLSAGVGTDSDEPFQITETPGDLLAIQFAELRETDPSPDVHHDVEIVDHETFMERTKGQARRWQIGIPSLLAVRRVEACRRDLQTSLVAYEALSDSAGDTTQKVSGYGFTDALRRTPRSVEVTLTGTTGVSLGSFLEMLVVSKSAKTAGIVTIRQTATPANVVAILGAYARAAAYRVFEMDLVPDRPLVLAGTYTRQPPMMMNDADVPWFLPPEAGEVLVEGGLVRARDFRSAAAWQTAQAKYREVRSSFLASRRSTEHARPRIRLR